MEYMRLRNVILVMVEMYMRKNVNKENTNEQNEKQNSLIERYDKSSKVLIKKINSFKF